MFDIPVISAQALCFSGFGRGDKTHTFGTLLERTGAHATAPLAVFIQTDDDGPSLGVYVGLFDNELDGSDHNIFRQYTIRPDEANLADDVLQLLGLFNTIALWLKTQPSIAQLDRTLIKHHHATREV